MLFRRNTYDERLKRRAQSEDCPVPAGFDERLYARLAALPERAENPPRRRFYRRTLALAAAAAAFATVAVAAVSLTLRQNHVFYFDSIEELHRAELSAHPDTELFGVSFYSGADYLDLDGSAKDWWWEHSATGDDAALIEETETEGVRQRLFRYEEDGTVFEEKACRSAVQSALAAYIPGQALDTAWLEAHYTANGDADLYIVRDAGTHAVRRFSAGGEYTGENGVIFNIEYSYDAEIEWEDQYEYMEDGRTYELYQTADGVTVAIVTGTSRTGKAMYWASLYAGHNDFQLFGTALTLDDLHALLDSLSLSVLCVAE